MCGLRLSMNSCRRLSASGGARSVSHFSKASGFSSKRRATSSTSCCVATDLLPQLAPAEGEELLLALALALAQATALAAALPLALALVPAAGELASWSDLASTGGGVSAAAC